MSAFWPTSVATNAQLYIAVNALQTTLSGSIDNVVTTITLASTTGFQTAGGVTIDSEVIFYTGISGAQLTGCTRGADGTTAASHSSGVPVGATVIAFHHNGLKDEIIAIETSLNLTASKAVATNASGRLTTSAVTSTELGYLSGVTSSIQTQLNAAIANPLTADLAAGTHKITGLGNATAAQDAAAFTQVKILQVVQASATSEVSTTSATYADTGLSASITPSNSANKILVIIAQNIRHRVLSGGSTAAVAGLRLLRGATQLIADQASSLTVDSTGNYNSMGEQVMMYLDSPSTTSSTTYKSQIARLSGAGTVYAQDGSSQTASWITLIEVNGL